MRIQCPSCQTIYDVKADSIGEDGRQVRCAKCKEKWHAVPMAEETPKAPKASKSAAKAKPAKTKPKPPKQDNPPAAPVEAKAAEEEEAWNEVAEDANAADDFDPSEADVTGSDGFDEADVASPQAEEAPASPVISKNSLNEMGGLSTATPGDDKDLPGRKLMSVEGGLNKLKEARERVGIMGSQVLNAPLSPVKSSKKNETRNDYIRIAVSGIAALLLIFGPLVYRHEVVGIVPDMAGFYAAIGINVNLRGLDFQGIETFRESEEGSEVLVVEGMLVNVDGRTRSVPAVRLALLGEDANELYAWAVEPRTMNLEPGETTRFRARLASPPPAATDVALRFVDRSQDSQGFR